MLEAYVFKCFRRVFQVFHLDVAYVAMWLYMHVLSICFQVFHMFQTDVTIVSYGYTRMFQVYVFKCF